MWNIPNNKNLPCIVEFGIDIEAEKPFSENENAFEEFPESKIEGVNKLFSTLQDKSIGIADFETSITKTQFVCDYRKQ